MLNDFYHMVCQHMGTTKKQVRILFIVRHHAVDLLNFLPPLLTQAVLYGLNARFE